MDTLNYLQAVKDGQLHFADGATQAIPHWGDPAWTHLFCVRHAEKDRDDPFDPGLTAEGEARAEHLGRILSEAGLNAVFSTSSQRALLTAEPVQRRSHTSQVETYNPEKQEEWLPEMLVAHAGERILIVGHQFTIPHLLNQLNGHGFEYDNIPNSDYGRFYVVSTQGLGHAEILTLRY